MNKDYIPSAKYTQEEIDRFGIPTYFQDACIDYYVRNKECVFSTSSLMQSYPLAYMLQSHSCHKHYKLWERCEKKREKEIEDKMSVMLRQKIAASVKGQIGE